MNGNGEVIIEVECGVHANVLRHLRGAEEQNICKQQQQ